MMQQFVERGAGREGRITKQQDDQETSERWFRNPAESGLFAFQLQTKRNEPKPRRARKLYFPRLFPAHLDPASFVRKLRFPRPTTQEWGEG